MAEARQVAQELLVQARRLPGPAPPPPPRPAPRAQRQRLGGLPQQAPQQYQGKVHARLQPCQLLAAVGAALVTVVGAARVFHQRHAAQQHFRRAGADRAAARLEHRRQRDIAGQRVLEQLDLRRVVHDAGAGRVHASDSACW